MAGRRRARPRGHARARRRPGRRRVGTHRRGDAASAAKARSAGDGGSVLITLSPKVADGASLLILHVHERSPEAADALAAQFGTAIERIGPDELAEQIQDVKRQADADDKSDEDSGSGSAAS